MIENFCSSRGERVQNAYHDGTAFADIEEGLVNTTKAPASAEMSFIYQGFISGLMS